MLEHDCYTFGICSHYKHWIKALSISSPLHRAGQSICSVLVNTASKPRETKIYMHTYMQSFYTTVNKVFMELHLFSNLLFCKQLAIESFKWSSSSSPCHLPPQERASRHGQCVLSKSNRELSQCITTAASAKDTS